MKTDYAKTLPQYLLPQHLLSRVAGKLAMLEKPVWLKNWLIRAFIRYYRVDMTEALMSNPEHYVNFNAFFTRELQPGARPVLEDIVSPVDGLLSEFGSIDYGKLLQAKGQYYHLTDLLGGDTSRAKNFENGAFATFYLAPKDYHRVHAPLTGNLEEMVYVPGRLFSVNLRTASTVPGLFARNERVIAFFKTEVGPVAVILVGAMIVASIATSWSGVVTPPRGKQIYRTHYNNITLEKGEELGYFQLGSTVIMLFGPQAITWTKNLTALQAVRMGQPIATIRR